MSTSIFHRNQMGSKNGIWYGISLLRNSWEQGLYWGGLEPSREPEKKMKWVASCTFLFKNSLALAPLTHLCYTRPLQSKTWKSTKQQSMSQCLRWNCVERNALSCGTNYYHNLQNRTERNWNPTAVAFSFGHHLRGSIMQEQNGKQLKPLLPGQLLSKRRPGRTLESAWKAQ